MQDRNERTNASLPSNNDPIAPVASHLFLKAKSSGVHPLFSPSHTTMMKVIYQAPPSSSALTGISKTQNKLSPMTGLTTPTALTCLR
jgi:hypothetical protein